MIQAILVFLMFCVLYFLVRPKSKPENKYPTIEDIRCKYPKRKSVELPTDGIYEDFSRDLVGSNVETTELEIAESSFNALLDLVRDRDEAIRRIQKNLMEGKSATWACEKAIADIEVYSCRKHY